MTLAEAISSLPIDNKAFNALRYRWMKVVRGHPLLTSAERHVGLVIAQHYLNRSPGHCWFNSAWASHQTLAGQVSLTRRTVLSAMTTLRLVGLIAIERGGGSPVVGGRTDRYTLRLDWLDVLERAARIIRHKEVKSFHSSNSSTDDQFEERCENKPESGEIDEGEMGNSPEGDVKTFLTTHSNKTSLKGLTTLSERQSEALPAAAALQAGHGRKKGSENITAQDHRDLAALLGEGDLERGYCRLYELDESDANDLAIRYRLDRSSSEAVRAEAGRRSLPNHIRSAPGAVVTSKLDPGESEISETTP
jgi:hypothetical protein